MNRAICFAAIAVTTIVAHANPTQVANDLLASKDGKTLYIFDKDSAGKSNCNGGCATAWPPFTVANPASAGGDFSSIQRDDGTSQWAYKSKPLYFFAGDARPGDARGDKQGGVWHVVRGTNKVSGFTGTSNGPVGYGY